MNMVKEVKRDDMKFYVCEDCGLSYEDKSKAQECQDWCEKNGSCNLAITKQSYELRNKSS